MKKADLIDTISSKAGITKRAAEDSINAFMEGVNKALSKGDRVTLVGFGTFSVRKRAARKARNPRTGAPIHVPSRNVPKFQPGAKMRGAVR
ncbi:MAG: HU family DNA-binding protein [Candidatus Stahlbacteria bacterium]|nr:HU family DNA-binding protein [Candidatus Stahlbacteria bacterium]